MNECNENVRENPAPHRQLLLLPIGFEIERGDGLVADENGADEVAQHTFAHDPSGEHIFTALRDDILVLRVS
jgi:hypothetical protein